MADNTTAAIAEMLVETLLEEPVPSAEEIVRVVLHEAADSIRALAQEYAKGDGVTRLIGRGLIEAADWLTETTEEEAHDERRTE